MNREQFLMGTLALFLGESSNDSDQGLRGAYIDPRYQTAIDFGQTSPYLQPWRAYQETLPASALRNALGINLNIDQEDPDVICQHLARCGIRHARIEMNWGNVFDGQDDSALGKNSRTKFLVILRACRTNNIRPLILLNSHQGLPCPMTSSTCVLAKPARKGERTVTLRSTAGLRARYSGFNHVSNYKACEVLITRIEPGGVVRLSRPLPKDLGEAGKEVSVGTLKYLPFGPPNSPEYAETRHGWQRYVAVVARFVGGAIAADNSANRGFDMEIWNELTFGSDFLSITNYYDPAPKYEDHVWDDLTKATAEVAIENASSFAGVVLCNGFSNTIPWPASSEQPRRIGALSKHPYAGRRAYKGKPEQHFPVVNAKFKAEEKPSFYPSYTSAFPEYFANALQTEHCIRDLSPITTPLYNTRHGRFVRGSAAPVRAWFTEWGLVPKEWGVDGVEAGRNLKARAYARALCFWVGKGLERLYFFAVRGGEQGLGIVSDQLLQRATTSGQLPADDTAYRTSVLATWKRLTDAFAGTDFRDVRPLKVEDIRDTHGNYQWRGDGTPEHPTLYNRECFAFLPFQLSASRYVIPYYVQTRDMSKSLPPEQYTVIVSGFQHPDIDMISRVYDPVTGKTVPGARVLSVQGNGHVSFSLPATDYPYLLIVDDQA